MFAYENYFWRLLYIYVYSRDYVKKKKRTTSGALITPVLYPNCNIPNTAASIAYDRKSVSPWKDNRIYCLRVYVREIHFF